MDYNN